jgi:hypothetical protein
MIDNDSDLHGQATCTRRSGKGALKGRTVDGQAGDRGIGCLRVLRRTGSRASACSCVLASGDSDSHFYDEAVTSTVSPRQSMQ